jgi:uncharacterized membrane protein YbhN (UPF0104 family)
MRSRDDLAASVHGPQRDDVTQHDVAVHAKPKPSAGKRIWRVVAFAIAIAMLVTLTLRGRLPSGPAVIASIRHAEIGWIAAAAAMQALSMLTFAAQQRALLQAWGVRFPIGRAMGVTLARSAISISLPAGAAVSAAYALRHYRRSGASPEIATATMIVSGLASIVGLAALYISGVLGIVTKDPTKLWTEPPAALAVTSIVLGGILAGLIAAAVTSFRRRRSGPKQPTIIVTPAPTGRWARYAWTAWNAAREAWRAGGSLRIRDWTAAFGYAAANWLTDLLCLAFSTRALGLPIGITTLASIYLGVQIVRQVPITPGGVGLIETAFIAGITAAGAGAASATAAVLLYRVLSCWLIIPIGFLAAIPLRREPQTSDPTDLAGTEIAQPIRQPEPSLPPT